MVLLESQILRCMMPVQCQQSGYLLVLQAEGTLLQIFFRAAGRHCLPKTTLQGLSWGASACDDSLPAILGFTVILALFQVSQPCSCSWQLQLSPCPLDHVHSTAPLLCAGAQVLEQGGQGGGVQGAADGQRPQEEGVNRPQLSGRSARGSGRAEHAPI